jgi:hypothetical protein
MNSRISCEVPLPSTSKGMARVSSRDSVGSAWMVAAGALACTEMQIAQGLEALELAISGCAWVASTPTIRRTRKTQVCAAQRCRRLFPNWLFLITGCFRPQNIAPCKKHGQEARI